MKWTAKDTEYFYTKVSLSDEQGDLKIVLTGRGMKPWKVLIDDFRQYTACDILQAYPELGRHFEDSLLKMYKELNLDMGFSRKICR